MKMSRLLTVVIAVCLWSVGVFARVNLYVFHRSPPAPHLIFPASDQESLADQIERYLDLIQRTPDLMILEPNFDLLRRELNPARAELYDPSTKPRNQHRSVLHANEFTDFAENNARVLRHTEFLKHRAVEQSYLIPVSGDLHLHGQDKTSYRAQVANNFRVRIGMGGDDVAPRLYGEPVTHSGRVSYTRDYSEYQMIRAYDRFDGLYIGICRGHQIGAVARGDRMYQDIGKDGVGSTNDHSNNGDYHSHQGKWNNVRLTHPLLIRMFGQEQISVNSLHHQAVRLTSGSSSILAGYSLGDGIVEALVSENGRAIGVQFHPEIATVDPQRQGYNELRLKFLDSVLDYSIYIDTHTPPYRSCRLVL